MNVTLSMDDELVARARRLAERKGTSLNQLIRDHLESLTALESRSAALDELEALWRDEAGDSKGERWTRESLYDRAVLR